MNPQPWAVTRLVPYGNPEVIPGEPVRVDPRTQMAVWQSPEGETIHTAKHRQSVKHTQTSTSRATDGSKPGDTTSDTDTNSTYD